MVSELYKRYGCKLYAYAIRSWHVREDDAWDLVYKTLYKVLDSYRNYDFDNEDKFASFVFRVFINYLRNHYRDHKKESEALKISDTELASLPEQPETILPDGENTKMTILNEELDKMEDWQRILLLMRSDGYAYSEIATFIDKPEDQLKVYYQRLKKRITDKINEQLS